MRAQWAMASRAGDQLLARCAHAEELVGVAARAGVGRRGEHVLGLRVVQRVVEPRDRARGVAESRMRGDVVDALAVDVDLAPVAQAGEIFRAGERPRPVERGTGGSDSKQAARAMGGTMRSAIVSSLNVPIDTGPMRARLLYWRLPWRPLTPIGPRRCRGRFGISHPARGLDRPPRRHHRGTAGSTAGRDAARWGRGKSAGRW